MNLANNEFGIFDNTIYLDNPIVRAFGVCRTSDYKDFYGPKVKRIISKRDFNPLNLKLLNNTSITPPNIYGVMSRSGTLHFLEEFHKTWSEYEPTTVIRLGKVGCLMHSYVDNETREFSRSLRIEHIASRDKAHAGFVNSFSDQMKLYNGREFNISESSQHENTEIVNWFNNLINGYPEEKVEFEVLKDLYLDNFSYNKPPEFDEYDIYFNNI